MTNPTHVKVSNFLAPMVEGNGVPVACKIVQMQHIDLALRQRVTMLRIVLHRQRTLFEGSSCQRLQKIWLDHHMRRGFESQRRADHVGVKGDLLREERG